MPSTTSTLEDLKEELIGAKRVAVDEEGRFLVWTGNQDKGETENQDSELLPVSYTPSHLAERIRAEQAAMEARGNVEGERKTITALFADIKGATGRIERSGELAIESLKDENSVSPMAQWPDDAMT